MQSSSISLQFSFVVGMFSVHAFYMCRYLIIKEKASRLQKRIVDEIDELYMLRRNISHYKKLVSYFYVLYSQVYISVPQSVLFFKIIIFLFLMRKCFCTQKRSAYYAPQSFGYIGPLLFAPICHETCIILHQCLSRPVGNTRSSTAYPEDIFGPIYKI